MSDTVLIMHLQLAFCLLLACFATSLVAEPLVIAHRGASGYLPEHTIAAYQRAIEMGADYIEPDLVLTKDGVLIARHEHYLGLTTDVARRFPDRKRALNGREDWFSEDLTLDEIRTLRTRQSFPGRDPRFDLKFGIPTFRQIIELVQRESARLGRPIGIYPETKVPSHFESLGFDVAGILLRTLEESDFNAAETPIFIQSFEPGILRKLNQETDLPLVMLIRPVPGDPPGTPNMPLAEIATFADGVGANKLLLLDPRSGRDSGFVSAASDHNLFVHAWTFRDDRVLQPPFESAEQELRFFLDLGIDGFFTDFPDTGVKVRNQFSRL